MILPVFFWQYDSFKRLKVFYSVYDDGELVLLFL